MDSLYRELKRDNPRGFRVDPHGSLDHVYVDFPFSCKDCVVSRERSPEHCDPCPVNPDRDRLKKVGLL